MTEAQKPEEKPEAAVTFETKEQFTELLQSKIGEALAPKLRKMEEMQAQITTLSTAQDRVSELEAQIAGETQTAAQKWDAERATHASQQKALQAQFEQAQAETAATVERWHGGIRRQKITEWGLEAGAAPGAIADVADLFPSDRIQVKEENGQLVATMIDPTTGIQADAVQAVGEWLKSKPHLLSKPNGGSGSSGAGAGKSPPAKGPEYAPTAQGFEEAFYPSKG